MAFHQILSEKELQIAPVGLYYVAGDDGATIDTVRDFYDLQTDQVIPNAPLRLAARVSEPLPEIPMGIEGVTARADGLQIVTAWVLTALAEAADKANVNPTSDPIAPATADVISEPSNVEPVACPNCGAPLTNAVIQNLTVCPNCGRTIALSDRTAALATGAQTVHLSPDTIKALKSLRPRR